MLFDVSQSTNTVNVYINSPDLYHVLLHALACFTITLWAAYIIPMMISFMLPWKTMGNVAQQLCMSRLLWSSLCNSGWHVLLSQHVHQLLLWWSVDQCDLYSQNWNKIWFEQTWILNLGCLWNYVVWYEWQGLFVRDSRIQGNSRFKKKTKLLCTRNNCKCHSLEIYMVKALYQESGVGMRLLDETF